MQVPWQGPLIAYITSLERPFKVCGQTAQAEVFNRYKVSHGLSCPEHGEEELKRLKGLKKGRVRHG